MNEHLHYAQWLTAQAEADVPEEPSFKDAVKLLHAMLHATLVVAELLDEFAQLVEWGDNDAEA